MTVRTYHSDYLRYKLAEIESYGPDERLTEAIEALRQAIETNQLVEASQLYDELEEKKYDLVRQDLLASLKRQLPDEEYKKIEKKMYTAPRGAVAELGRFTRLGM